jgi:hypothetical protein
MKLSRHCRLLDSSTPYTAKPSCQHRRAHQVHNHKKQHPQPPSPALLLQLLLLLDCATALLRLTNPQCVALCAAKRGNLTEAHHQA